MLSVVLGLLISLLLGVPLLLVLLLLLMPRPLLEWADRRAYKALDVESYNKASPYSSAGFLPVHSLLSGAEITVSGKIPEELEGVYLRNGTNLQFDKTEGRYHMFNGAGMLHQIHIKNGSASYTNCYVKTPRYKIEDAAGKDLYVHFGDIAGGGKAGLFRMIIAALKQRFGVMPALEQMESGSSTTAIQYHHGKLYCLQETGYPFALNTSVENGKLHIDGSGDWDTFGGKLDSPFTAHPKIDPETGDWYTFSTEFRGGKIHHAVLKQGQLTTYSVIDQKKPALAFLHDYYLTENYLVFPDLSLRFDPAKMMSDEKSPMVFDPGYKMRWGVIKRDYKEGDAIHWFDTDKPGHLWHTVNGWEETRDDGGTDIVVFAPVFRSYPSNIPIHNPQEPHTEFTKWRLNLDTGKVTEDRVLLDHFYERPSFNTRYVGKKNHYAYLLDEQKEGMMAKGVLKYDMINEREVKYVDYGEFYGGEALFVPRHNASAEDDGYLLDLLMTADKAELLILDAASMEEVARLHLPQRVPFGVHSCWLDQEKISRLQ